MIFILIKKVNLFLRVLVSVDEKNPQLQVSAAEDSGMNQDCGYGIHASVCERTRSDSLELDSAVLIEAVGDCMARLIHL